MSADTIVNGPTAPELLAGAAPVPQQPEAPQEQQAAPVEQVQEAPREKPVKESTKEYNLRVMRERVEAAEKRAQELERYIQTQTQNAQPQQRAPQVEEEDIAVNDDDIIDGRSFKSHLKKVERKYEQKLQQFEQKAVASLAEVELKAKHDDLHQVVNDENVRTFAMAYPEDYASMMSNPDPRSRIKTAYNMIKNYGIAEGNKPQPPAYTANRLETNQAKPKSVSTAVAQTAETPLTRLGDYDRRILTKERIAQLQKQVDEAKRYGGY